MTSGPCYGNDWYDKEQSYYADLEAREHKEEEPVVHKTVPIQKSAGMWQRAAKIPSQVPLRGRPLLPLFKKP